MQRRNRGAYIMSLTPDDPFKHLENIRKDFDSMLAAFPFDMIFGENLLSNFESTRVTVHETDTEVVVACDIPGLERKEDIHINVDHYMLSISGFTNKSTEVKDENMFRLERYAGSFHRSIPLPSPVSKNGVKATYRNGVLEVRMPKTTQIIEHKIDVEFD